MFVLPFLFTPLGSALEAYKSTRVEEPIATVYSPFGRRIYKGSDEYDRFIELLPGAGIKAGLKSFFDKMDIRKDLLVLERRNLGIGAAQGTNFFPKGNAVIWLAPGFHDADKDACHWVIKHEACHIKNNDCFTLPLVSAICSTAAAIFSTFLMPVIPAILVTITVGCIAQAMFSQYREGKADDLAIAESSIEELKGGRRFLMALKATNLSDRNTTWKKISISSSGENRLDIFHPSTASRLKKIERELQRRGEMINPQEESAKIRSLTGFLVNENSILENELKELGVLGFIIAMNN